MTVFPRFHYPTLSALWGIGKPILDLQLKLTHLCFFFPAVFWGDIALDEEDLKLFHIDKAQDWVKQSVEEAGHSTGEYCIPQPCPGRGRSGLQQEWMWTTGHWYSTCQSSAHLSVENQMGHPSFSAAGCGTGASKFAGPSKKISI